MCFLIWNINLNWSMFTLWGFCSDFQRLPNIFVDEWFGERSTQHSAVKALEICCSITSQRWDFASKTWTQIANKKKIHFSLFFEGCKLLRSFPPTTTCHLKCRQTFSSKMKSGFILSKCCKFGATSFIAFSSFFMILEMENWEIYIAEHLPAKPGARSSLVY